MNLYHMVAYAIAGSCSIVDSLFQSKEMQKMNGLLASSRLEAWEWV